MKILATNGNANGNQDEILVIPAGTTVSVDIRGAFIKAYGYTAEFLTLAYIEAVKGHVTVTSVWPGAPPFNQGLRQGEVFSVEWNGAPVAIPVAPSLCKINITDSTQALGGSSSSNSSAPAEDAEVAICFMGRVLD